MHQPAGPTRLDALLTELNEILQANHAEVSRVMCSQERAALIMLADAIVRAQADLLPVSSARLDAAAGLARTILFAQRNAARVHA